MNDIRYAARQLRKAPIFTVVAVLTLGLGIGANTAIFTLLDQALIRPLPVSHPEQLVRLRYTGESPGHTNTYGGDDNDFFSYPMYQDLRDRNTAFAALIANDEQKVQLDWQGRSELADAELVSGNYFEVLGVQPALGRLLVPADEQPRADSPVVLSFNYWKTKLGADSQVIGQTLRINVHPFIIVGVAPPQFHSVVAGETPALFVPATAKNVITPAWQDLQDRQSHWLNIVGRLRAGVTRQQAQASLEPLWHAIRADELKQFGYQNQRTRRLFLDESHIQLLDAARGFSPLRDDIGTPLLILMGMVGVLALMACINVSSLLLVRAAGRAREMSVRYAMGARRGRVVRQLLVEGMVLGLLGGGLALAVAPPISAVLLRMVFADSASQIPFSTTPDVRIWIFNFGVAFATSILFSLAPALRFVRTNPIESLKQQAASSQTPLSFRRVSVGAQIGLSLLLLFGAGLFVRTLQNLRSVNIGFVSDHLISFRVNPQLAGYKSDQLVSLNQRILDTLGALPGVHAVAATDDLDLTGSEQDGNVTIEGYKTAQDEQIRIEKPRITPGYFATMQVPLLAGRGFSDRDVAGNPLVAVVSASFANRYFGSPQNAIGRRISFTGTVSDAKFDTEIVGVAGDTKHSAVRDPVRPTVYRALAQSPRFNHISYVVRTSELPQAAIASVRGTMQQLDPSLALSELKTVDQQIAESLANERLIALLSVSFGVLAMLLAAIGLYGVLAYSTAQRTREIGIRMALGARRTTVVRLVLGDVLWLAVISMAATLPIALLASQMLRSQLYNVSPADPVVFASGVLLVSAVVVIAALVPARRAATVEPMQALRTE